MWRVYAAAIAVPAVFHMSLVFFHEMISESLGNGLTVFVAFSICALLFAVSAPAFLAVLALGDIRSRIKLALRASSLSSVLFFSHGIILHYFSRFLEIISAGLSIDSVFGATYLAIECLVVLFTAALMGGAMGAIVAVCVHLISHPR